MKSEHGAREMTGTNALSQEFCRAAARAYTRPYLVSNSTLSKINQHSLFFKYSQGEAAQFASSFSVALNVLLFYAKSLIEMLLLIGALLLQKISRHQRFSKSQQELFIDAYVVVDSRSKTGLENSFPFLQPVAHKHNWKPTILPRFYGSRNPFLRQKQITFLRAAGFDVLTEQDLLTLGDYLYLCVHICAYPWLVLALVRSLPKTREGLFVRFALLSEIGQSSLSGAIRYRQGRRLAALVSSKDRLVQWYENQPYDKNLIRGLRSRGARLPIYGAQLYIGCPEIANLRLDKTEPRWHSPDIILVTGGLYLDENANVPYKVGPSLRYAKLFNRGSFMADRKNTLVLMSYMESSAVFTQQIALQTQPLEDLVFKFHPAAPHPTLRRLITGSCRIISGDLYDALENTRFVIGSASGALLEAIVLGIPVIVAREPGNLHFSYIPEIGRGLLWAEVSSVSQAPGSIEQLLLASENRKEEALDAREQMRKQCFGIEPTAEAIKLAFDL